MLDELQGNKHKKWVCAGGFNRHHTLWDGNGRESAGSWREVKELIEPGTPTWKGGDNHRSSTTDLVIESF
jgi:hypothetical protein